MHYLGMKSMRMGAVVDYEPRLFLLSIGIAIATSGAALKLAHSIPRSDRAAFYMKAGSAVVMGIAISGMHYVAMAAARYRATTVAENAGDDPRVGSFALSDTVAIAGVIFGGALLALAARTAVERRRALEVNERLTAELEQRVQRRTAELEARNADLAAFSYSVSHDLRGPLRTVTGYGELLLDGHAQELSEEARHYLGRILAATRRMDTLLDGLLTLAHVSQLPLRRETVDLSEIARQAVADLAAQDPRRRVDVTIDDALVACGDPALLTSAVQNLLANAWKFTGKKPEARIHFGQRTRDSGPEFFVWDNGAGFDTAHLAKLFGMFERLHGVTEFPGHGIGLAVTKRVIERHGGRIHADSVQGLWSEFVFTLPDLPADGAAPRARAPSS